MPGYLASIGSFERNVKLFLTVTALRGMLIASLQTVVNLYLYSLGYDARFIGIINGSNAVAVLVVSVPLGYVADRVGRRPVLLVGGAGYPLAILFLSLSHGTALIMVFNFLFGAFSSAYWVAGVPLLFASTKPHERVQAFSINSFLLWGLGPLGALISGQVVEAAARIGGTPASSSSALRIGLFFIVLLGAVGFFPLLFLRERRAAVPHAKQPAPSSGSVSHLIAKLLTPDLLLAFGGGAVLSFAQLYFHLRFHLDPGTVGIVVAVGGSAAGLATLLTPIVARRWGNLRTAVRAQWSAAPFIVVMALTMRFEIALPAYCLLLMLRGMADPVYTGFVQERVPETHRARVTGLYSVTYSIGYSLGPAASGALQTASGFGPAFLMGAVVYFTGASLLFGFFREGTRPLPVAGTGTGEAP